jgi:hypothetical protein
MQWIRLNTPASAVFLAPPWERTFWIEAERAQVVSHKRVPHSAAIVEWYERMTAINGGPFHAQGQAALDELQHNYASLTAARAQQLAARYGAGYFLALRPLDELSGSLVYQNGSYYLYQLKP